MTPALVLGSAHATTLEVIRMLGRKGTPQFVVGAGRSIVRHSRWHRPLPDQQGEPDPSSLPQILARVPFERMVLVPCADPWVAAIASLDPALTVRFPAIVGPPESLEILLDKGRFAEAAQRVGVPHARTICLASEDDVARLPDSALQNTFLKPRETLAFQWRYGAKALRFETRSQAVALVRDACRAGLQLLLQEYIPGPPACHSFLCGYMDRRGTVRACVVASPLRLFPRDFGDTCCGLSIRPEEVAPAMEALKWFLGALRYHGVFAAEFKYDERDGLFKVLEINARPFGYIGFIARCGVDLVAMAYQDALGLPVEHVEEYEIGRRYFNPYLDRPVAWRLIKKGKLTPWRWACSWLGAYQPFFSLDDPLPGMVEFSARLRSFARRRVGWPSTR